MNDLSLFAQQIENRLSTANREPSWGPGEAERYMSDFLPRRERFEQLASQLTRQVVEPRVDTLVSYFTNAHRVDDEPLGHCICRFNYCERFPNNVMIELSWDHDKPVQELYLLCHVWIRPVYIKYDTHDRLVVGIGDVDEAAIAQWVEERLLAFLDTYLAVDRGHGDFKEDVVTDPVCGMRLGRSEVVDQRDHKGHHYHFCSTNCAEAFTKNPDEFVIFKPW